jgi:hypothetical protein
VSLDAGRVLREHTGAAPVPGNEEECAALLDRLDVAALPAPPLAPAAAPA